MADKYVVFKKEDLEESSGVLPEPLHDAVVIRHQDLFSEHGLRAYAGAVITAMDIIQETVPVAQRIGMMGMIHSLQDLADYFNDQADLASAHKHKIPD